MWCSCSRSCVHEWTDYDYAIQNLLLLHSHYFQTRVPTKINVIQEKEQISPNHFCGFTRFTWLQKSTFFAKKKEKIKKQYLESQKFNEIVKALQEQKNHIFKPADYKQVSMKRVKTATKNGTHAEVETKKNPLCRCWQDRNTRPLLPVHTYACTLFSCLARPTRIIFWIRKVTSYNWL